MKTNIPEDQRREIINDFVWACLHTAPYELTETEWGTASNVILRIFKDQTPYNNKGYHTNAKANSVQHVKKNFPDIYKRIKPWVTYSGEDNV